MDENINIGHPFYFPTQVVLLDDDPDFLDGVSLMLNKELSYKLFQSASQALEYVNNAHKQVSFLQRCYTNYKTGPMVSDSLSHIDIGKIHREVLNSNRFQTCSSIIVDYSMPEMNGLEFLMSLKNPYIKKVLLTGQADMELAVKAFNKQLIDQFIDKHDPRLKSKLNSTISSFQDQYFRSSFKLITDPIIANNHDAFLVDTEFQKFFSDLRSKLDCVEFYMIDDPHTGFLLVDSVGECRCLLIYTGQSLAEHCQDLEQMGVDAELLDKVKSGQLIPGFDAQDENLKASDPKLTDWHNTYYPALKIDSEKKYYVSIISDKLIPELQDRKIVPYSDFLEYNCTINQVVH